jgi:hypothetical protein
VAFIPELEDRPLAELLAALDSGGASAGAPEDEVELWLDEAARLIAGHPGGLDLLLERIPAGDEQQVAAILLGLSFVPPEVLSPKRDQLRTLLLTFAHGPQPNLAAGAIDTLRHLDYADVRERLLPLLGHPSPYVVGSVLRFLSRHDPEGARPLLLKALASPEPIIRQNAADELDNLDCTDALPALRQLVDDPDPDVRQAVRTAIENLEQPE